MNINTRNIPAYSITLILLLLILVCIIAIILLKKMESKGHFTKGNFTKERFTGGKTKSGRKNNNMQKHPLSPHIYQLDEELGWEYSRYLVVLQIKYAIENAIKPRDRRQQYETDNIIERYILEMANDNDRNDPIFTDSIQPIGKLFGEIREKFPHIRPNSLEKLQEKLLIIIRDFVVDGCTNSDIIENIKPKYITSDNNRQIIFRCGKYEAVFPAERIKLLINIAGECACSRMLMRYACLLSRGQQWSHEPEFFDKLYKHGVRYEGFASPINSKLIGCSTDNIDPANSRAYFCSLFPDVDNVFGSIGQFFDVDFAEIADNNQKKIPSGSSHPTTIFLNPPFIESIFDRIADKIADELGKTTGKLRFIYASAYWPDAIGIKKMLSSQYFRASRIMNKGDHCYIDNTGKRFPARFDTVLILLDNIPDDSATTRANNILDDIAGKT